MNRRFSLIVAAMLLALAASAQNSSSHSPHQINSGFFAALDGYRHSHSAASLQQLQNEVSKRQQALYSLMATAPDTVLGAVIPDDVRGGMPASVRAMLEQRTTLRGQAEVSVEDGPANHRYSKMHYGIVVGGQHFSLNFAGQAPANWQHGINVEVTGVQVGDAIALTSDNASVQE
jgi:hypothetical protein